METALLVVTLVALALAVSMSVVAWRLLREQRVRSTVRVQTLAALAGGESVLEPIAPMQELPSIEKRAAVRERPATEWDAKFRDTESETETEIDTGDAPVEMFEAAAVPGAPARRWLALAAVALSMAAGMAALYVMRSGDVGTALASSASAAVTPIPTSHARPLELLSLGHNRDSGDTFTITGFVRNPADAQTLGSIVVVVYLFDQQGRYFASGRANLDAARLTPGEQAAFTVRIPNVAGVTRYRVGFRSPQGDVVAHVDKRGADGSMTVGAL